MAQEVDPQGGDCTIAVLLAQAETLACQGGTARLRMIIAQTICDNIDLGCPPDNCTQPQLVEAAIAILVCRILNAIQIS